MKRRFCGFSWLGIVVLVATMATVASSVAPPSCMGSVYYDKYYQIGSLAASEARSRISSRSMALPFQRKWIALSNAGYAEPNGEQSLAALDGLSDVLGVSRGSQTLVEVHSAPERPLWFAIYDDSSGFMAYMEVNSEAIRDVVATTSIFKVASVENVKADFIFKNPESFAPQFGGNEFAVVTIANAVAAGAPAYAFRSFEFHDHYCPGVTSGILMAQYAKKYFSGRGPGSWFVQGLQPWCKEDALMVMLNATPGKSGYGVIYSTPEQRKAWHPYEDAVNIIFRFDSGSNTWEGLVLGFQWADQTGCEQYQNSTINKLCADLYYLNYLDQPEKFVRLLTTIKLDPGIHPKTLKY
ncbi:MAG: FmdE family protein [Desulfosoma sp.]